MCLFFLNFTALIEKRVKNMSKWIAVLALISIHLAVWGQGELSRPAADSIMPRHEVLLQTTKGDIVVDLYNETPKHRDNFLKLVSQGFYDGVLWHRVIADFMIQTGDSTTRHALPGSEVGEHDVDYTIPAEIDFPRLFHKRGALAAARESDSTNPERRSSGSQFYIVYGSVYGPNGLDKVQQKLDARTDSTVKLTPEVRTYYTQHGGTPHLDGQYTVFGEVVKGLDVVKEIDYVETDGNDRPLADVRIIKASVLH
jgi:cyclophilin family peptidyl-prolyl cis-trans isomerase